MTACSLLVLLFAFQDLPLENFEQSVLNGPPRRCGQVRCGARQQGFTHFFFLYLFYVRSLVLCLFTLFRLRHRLASPSSLLEIVQHNNIQQKLVDFRQLKNVPAVRRGTANQSAGW